MRWLLNQWLSGVHELIGNIWSSLFFGFNKNIWISADFKRFKCQRPIYLLLLISIWWFLKQKVLKSISKKTLKDPHRHWKKDVSKMTYTAHSGDGHRAGDETEAFVHAHVKGSRPTINTNKFLWRVIFSGVNQIIINRTFLDFVENDLRSLFSKYRCRTQ